MGEETSDQQGEEDQPASEHSGWSFDDKRFEVKWQKKASWSSTPGKTEAGESQVTEELEPDDLRRELAQAREQVENLRDRWQRSAADLANLRRRTEEEKGDVEKFAAMLLVAELLPVLDNFDRAIATIPGDLAMLTWLHGVILIERQLRSTLERQGLKVVEAEGKLFNPALHEALAEKETDEAAPGSILQVYQNGYELNGRLIRPALVEIAKAPVQTQAEAEATSEEQAGQVAEVAQTENVGP